MIAHKFNPVFLDLGIAQVHYYGLFYIVGLIITYFLVKSLAKNRKVGLSDDDVLDYIIWLAFGILIGGRLFYFVFYDHLVLLKDPIELFKLWKGGMSFHGSLIGALTAGFVFCKIKKVSFYKLADITVIPIALSLAIGRIGNFINGELYGRVWDGILCIDYSTNEYITNPPFGCRYPSQLAESGKNILIFAGLWIIKDIKYKGKKLPDGSLFWGFILMYSLLRFFIEFIREPDSQLGFVLFGWMTMGQVLCLIMFILGWAMIFILFAKSKKTKSNK